MKTNASKKIRKGDKVIAISGNYKGMSGKVLACSGEKVLVEGINVRKRHMKGSRDQKGSIVQVERPVHVSNLKICDAEGKPVKLLTRTSKTGERELYYKEGNRETVHRSIKKAK